MDSLYNNNKNSSFNQVAYKGPRQQVAQKGARSQVAHKGQRSQVAHKGFRQSVDHDDEGPRTPAPQTCSLIDQNQRCHERVGFHEYTKSMQKAVKLSRKLKLKIDNRARHEGICDYHKTMIKDAMKNSMSFQQKGHNSSSTDSDDDDETEVAVEDNEEDANKEHKKIDFSRFPLTTLLRYKRHFMIPGSQHSKADLSKIIANHFKRLQVLPDEQDIAADFIFKVKY